MTDEERQRLAAGLADLVSRAQAGAGFTTAGAVGAERSRGAHVEVRCNLYPPPRDLTPIQLVCLAGLVGDPVPVGAVVDALMEAGQLSPSMVEIVRAEERAKVVAGLLEIASARDMAVNAPPNVTGLTSYGGDVIREAIRSLT